MATTADSKTFSDPVGALWIRLDPNGPGGMAGVVTVGGVKYQVEARFNDKGNNDRRPDYLIYLRGGDNDE